MKKHTAKKPNIRTVDQCMDVFDWFDDDRYGYIRHIWLSKTDAEARLSNAMPGLIREATQLVMAHRGQEDAYPEEAFKTTAA